MALDLPLPPCLKGKLTVEQYNKWLWEQATSIFNRERRDIARGKLKARLFQTREELAARLHTHTMMVSNGRDYYTDGVLDWPALKKRLNAGLPTTPPRSRLEMSLACNRPTFDHLEGQTKPRFRLCAASTNHAKCYLSKKQFVGMCKKVAAHHP